jgi:hypothetical protein
LGSQSAARSERGVARLASDLLGALPVHPPRRHDEDRERLRRLQRDDRPEARRQTATGEQSFPDFRVVAEPRVESAQRARRQIRRRIADQRQRRLAPPDFGERGGGAPAEPGTARDRALRNDVSGRGALDELGVGQQRRAGEHRRGDPRLVVRQSDDKMARRVARAGNRLRQRAPHLGGGIVDQRGHRRRSLGSGPFVEVGMKKSPRERAHRLGARSNAGLLRPNQESAHDAVPARGGRPSRPRDDERFCESKT